MDVTTAAVIPAFPDAARNSRRVNRRGTRRFSGSERPIPARSPASGARLESASVEVDQAALEARMSGTFPQLIGIEVDLVEHGHTEMRLPIRSDHLAPNGYLHAGVVVGLADSACGFGCMLSLPEGGIGFTTIELKTNFLGTALEGELAATAKLVHGGRTTQIWDAEVRNAATGKVIAMFRCTQLVLYPPNS